MQQNKPKLLVIAGPNGSGKTSLTHVIVKHEWIVGCEYINPDDIARDMFGDWNATEAVMSAAKYATEKREQCILQGKSLLFETVFSASDKLDFLIRAKQAGYFIRLFFVGTNHPGINANRIAHRVMEGGHEVPISKIVSRYSKSITNCAEVACRVDRLYVYDNSIDGQLPELLFRARSGQIVKTYTNINPWATEIMKKLL